MASQEFFYRLHLDDKRLVLRRLRDESAVNQRGVVSLASIGTTIADLFKDPQLQPVSVEYMPENDREIVKNIFEPVVQVFNAQTLMKIFQDLHTSLSHNALLLSFLLREVEEKLDSKDDLSKRPNYVKQLKQYETDLNKWLTPVSRLAESFSTFDLIDLKMKERRSISMIFDGLYLSGLMFAMSLILLVPALSFASMFVPSLMGLALGISFLFPICCLMSVGIYCSLGVVGMIAAHVKSSLRARFHLTANERADWKKKADLLDTEFNNFSDLAKESKPAQRVNLPCDASDVLPRNIARQIARFYDEARTRIGEVQDIIKRTDVQPLVENAKRAIESAKAAPSPEKDTRLEKICYRLCFPTKRHKL